MKTLDSSQTLLHEAPQHFEEFTFVREEIRFQHDLLGHRIGSFLTAQSFLVTALAISAASNSGDAKLITFTRWILPGLGVAISILIGMAVIAACKRITGERKVIQELPIRKALLPENTSKWAVVAWLLAHDRSLWYAKLMPLILIGFWIAAAVLLRK